MLGGRARAGLRRVQVDQVSPQRRHAPQGALGAGGEGEVGGRGGREGTPAEVQGGGVGWGLSVGTPPPPMSGEE